MEFQSVGTLQFVYMIIGTILFVAVPIIIALIWKFKKKERITTMLVGAVVFFVFVWLLVYSSLWMCGFSFHEIWKLFNHYCFKFYFWFFSLLCANAFSFFIVSPYLLYGLNFFVISLLKVWHVMHFISVRL